jgi:2,3-bisphosphoglycerate-independent phosphoglycerate mutase
MASIHGICELAPYHRNRLPSPLSDAIFGPKMTPTHAPPRPIVLVILDGFGERKERADNAVRLARTPTLSSIEAQYPHGLIGTSGPDVGLPPGQMGNSEVGHLNLGAGRIAMMDISKIDNALYDGTLATNNVVREIVRKAKDAGGRLHLIGLVSDGGVHSTLTHLSALIDLAKAASMPVVVHAFLDGRDVQPGTAPRYVAEVERKLAGQVGHIGTVSGRYWGMDRDNRWERVERSYRAIVQADGSRVRTAQQGIENSYAAGKTDEFVEPVVVGDYDGVKPGDVALHFNFRPDRARELTRALAIGAFDAFARKDGRAPFEGRYACMTTYDSSLGLPVAFPKEAYANVFPEILARAGLKQFRCAETEKYAHVTYFFNGGREDPFEGEDRKMLASPKDVATYDEKPEMAAAAVAEATESAIRSGKYDFVLVNFANPDMIGHTGMLDAAIRAVEVVDAGVGKIVDAARSLGGAVFITADHGNCELMKDPATGQPHTAHTLNPVPFLYVNDTDRQAQIAPGGRLCDVAPTLLALLGLPQPQEMSGRSLLVRA